MTQKKFILVFILISLVVISGCILVMIIYPALHPAKTTGCIDGENCPATSGTSARETITNNNTVSPGRADTVTADVPSCGNDIPTAASLEEAAESLASGNESAALSPEGCIRYRKKSSGAITVEEILLDNRVLSRTTHTLTLSRTERDADLDGFFEWRSTLVKGSYSDEDRIVIREFGPESKNLTSIRTYTRNGDDIHVLVQSPDDTGVLTTIQQYDTPVLQPGSGLAATPGFPAVFYLTSLFYPPTPCPPEEEAMLRERLSEGVMGVGVKSGGLGCLFKMGAKEQYAAVLEAFSREKLFYCSIPENDEKKAIAAYETYDSWFSTDPVTVIFVNPGRFDSLSSEEQRSILFHEMLHSWELHDPDAEESNSRKEVDPIYACQVICLNSDGGADMNYDIPDIYCATCLKTDRCDKRCEKFARSTDSVVAYRCNDPLHRKYSSDCESCLGSCKASSCTPVSRGCAGEEVPSCKKDPDTVTTTPTPGGWGQLRLPGSAGGAG
jgi:hypothetical protein